MTPPTVRLAAVLLCLLVAGLRPSTADAHQRLVRSEPARDAVARAVPAELRLVFAEPVELGFTRLELIGPAGMPVPLGSLGLAPDSSTVLVAPIAERLEAGIHTVRWSTTSRDGHPVRGEYEFTVAGDAARLEEEPAGPVDADTTAVAPVSHDRHPAPAPASSAAHVFDAGSPAFVAVRWLGFIGLLGSIGAVSFALLVLGYLGRKGVPDEERLIGDARKRAAGAGLGFVGLLLLAAVARLYAQSLALHGSELALDTARIGSILTGTVWGGAWLLQVGAAGLAGIGLALARGGAAAGWAMAAVAALALAVTPALSGHAVAMTGAIGAVAIVADTAHVLAAAGWLGALLMLVVAGVPAAIGTGLARRGTAVASLVRAFSPTALVFASILVVTGIAATVIHSPSLSALLASRYGTLLILKLALFVLVLSAGAYNYRRVLPSLGDDAGTVRIRRSAGVELVLGAGVLLITAMLVATARPYEEAALVTRPASDARPAEVR